MQVILDELDALTKERVSLGGDPRLFRKRERSRGLPLILPLQVILDELHAHV